MAHKAQRARGTAPGTSGVGVVVQNRGILLTMIPPVPPHSQLPRPGTPGPQPLSQSVPDPCPGLKSGLVLQRGCQLALEQNLAGEGPSPYSLSFLICDMGPRLLSPRGCCTNCGTEKGFGAPLLPLRSQTSPHSTPLPQSQGQPLCLRNQPPRVPTHS